MGNWRVTRKGAGHRLYDMTGGTQRRVRKILSIMLAVLMVLVSPVGSIPAKAADEWTIVFDANGGSFANGTTLEVKIPSDQPITRPNEVPTLAGNALLGWSESGIKYSFSGIKTVEEEFGNTVYANDKKVTLKAIWEADDSKVLYDGGSVTDKITGKSRGYYRITPQTTDEYTISFDVTGLNTSTAITNSKFWIEYRGESRADILDQGETGLSYTRKLERGITYYWSIYNNTSYTANIKVSIESKNGGGLPKIDDCTVTFVENTTYVYNGQAHQPEVIVKDGNTTLVKGTHYTVDYSNNTNVGTAAVIVSGDGVHYTGGKTLNFTIGQGVAPNQPNSPMEITDDNVTKVSQISLEEYPGWIWRGSSENKELIVGSTVEAEVIYKSEADIKNYSNSPTTITITKPQKPLESITLDKSNITLLEGDKEQLTATLVPSDAGYVASWSSSDSTIAEVSDKGLVTAKKAGNATITASAGTGIGKKTATCTVTVKAVPKADLSANETSVEFGKLEYGYNTPASQTITIENAGDAEAENVTIELENGTDSKFTLDSGQTSVLKSIAAKNGSVNGKATISIAPKSGLSANKYSDKVNVKYGGSTLFSIPVSFEVTKKNVTITADNKTREYLGEDPEWSCQISPQVDIPGITYTTTATKESEVGEYKITVNVGSTNPNYDIKTVDGILKINPKTVTDVSFPKAEPIRGGSTLGEVQLTDKESDYGTFAWKDDENTTLSKGEVNKDMVLTLSDFAKKNYSFTGVDGYNQAAGTITRAIKITVTSANLPTITFPSVASPLKYGDWLSSATFTYSPSTAYGSFAWKENIKLDETQIAKAQEDSQKSTYYTDYTLVFSWDLDAWRGILDAEGEPYTIEMDVRVDIERADNTETVPTDSIKASERGNNFIRLQNVDAGKVEYSRDGVNWQSGNTIEFYGLNSYTPYTIYARYKETKTHKASASASQTIYTLVADPYAIDLSKITDSNYRDALYASYVEGANNHCTVKYTTNGVLTLQDSGQRYTLTGNANVTVNTAESGMYNITLNNGTAINNLEVTTAAKADITVSGTVNINGEIVSNAATDVNISVSGSLTAKDIYVPEGTVTITGQNLNIGAPGAGKAGISAKDVKITDSTLTVTGGDGEPAIKGSNSVIIEENSTVTANAGKGASAIQGGEIILDSSDLQVEVEEGSEIPAIAAGEDKDIIEKGNPSINSNTSDNIYSKTPKDDKGNTKSKVTVTYLDVDESVIRNRTVDSGTNIVLPSIDKQEGYKMTWQNRETGQSYEPGATVTVTKDTVFIIVETKILVTRITLDSTKETIKVGESTALAETVEPADAYDTSVTWSTNNPGVATVNKDGEVTGVAEGTAIITVKANDGSNVSATCTVTVLSGEPEDVDVSSIKITGDTKKVAPGKKIKLTATVSPANATNKQVTWRVNNTKYASVSSSGVVTTKKAGAGKSVTVTVTSKADGAITATYKISIMKKAVTKIKLSASKKTLKKGKSVTVKAKFTPASGISKELSWTTNKPKVATVNAKGKVTAKGKGKAKITAKAKDGSGKKATITITVK